MHTARSGAYVLKEDTVSNTLVKQLAEKRQSIWEQTKALLDTAAEANRDLTAEEEGSYQALSADLTALRSRIDALQATEDANRSAEEALTRMLGNPEERRTNPGRDLVAEFRQLANGEIRSIEIGADQMTNVWSRALAKGTPTAGGNTVPTSFQDQLVEHMVETSGLLQLGPTVLNTTSGENIEIPKTTNHGAAALTAENAALGGTDPAFGKTTLGAYKYGQLILVPNELVTDTAVDLEGYIARAAGRNVGLAFGAHLVTGTGTNQPQGVVTGATLGKTGATGVVGAPSADDLIDLMFSVISPYRNSPSAGWLMKDSTLALVRKLKDGAGRYLFEPAATYGQPDTLLGKAIATDPNVAATALSAKSVLFGDWSAYFVRIAGGVRFEKSTDYAFGNDQVAFRAITRGDGALADTSGAIKFFAGAAT